MEMQARTTVQPKPVSLARASTSEGSAAHYRYGVVFLLVISLVLFEIIAAAGDWQRGVAVLLAGAALVVSVATWRSRTPQLDRLMIALGAAVAAVAIGIATGMLSAVVSSLTIGLFVLIIPATLARGLLRLVDEKGATLQVIAGALTVYLILGLVFASAIAVVAETQSGPYFAQSAVSNGDRVYYSFTVLTTTGFGDYSAATGVGHALAVLEMLTGQLYLVTVIGILIGHYVRGRGRPALERRSP